MTPPPSDHFNGKTFFYPHAPTFGRRTDLLRWKLTSRPARWPAHIPLDPPPPPPPVPRGHDIVATWLGHSTYLLQTAHGNFLTDPVFSTRTSPVSWAGPRRVHAPGLALAALPRIDVVLLSHDHYDHCDEFSLRHLAAAHDPLFVAPLRHTDLLTRFGARRLVELDWWQTHTLAAPAAASLTLTPARHWSNRLGTPRNHRLWGGFYLTLPSALSLSPPNLLAPPSSAATTPTASGPVSAASPLPSLSPSPAANSTTLAQTPAVPRRVWFAGDSGYDQSLFSTIRTRHGAPDLALIPIGAYEPRWFMAPMHMNPAEAVQTHRDIGARRSLAMHWGTFQLTDEARDAPSHALAAARRAAELPAEDFEVVAPGASVTV